METTESPLDVLSRAATMVQDHSSEVGAASDAPTDSRPRPHKELPTTRWRRDRRTRQVRHAAASASSSSSGAIASSAAAAPGPGDAAAAATLPPAGTRARTAAAAAAAAAVQATTKTKTTNDDDGPPPLLPLPLDGASGFPIRSSPPSPEVLVARTAPDSPLDMSTRSRGSPPPYSCPSAPPRPSVITCAPAASASPSGNHSWNQQPESGNSNRQGHRRELLSGMCDPVIDEHFRRSLGKDYLSIFRDEGSEATDAPDQKDSKGSNSNSITVTGLSVDDHFAKALGDTWVKLQEQSATETAARSSSTTNLARDKKQAALPQQPQQPPARGIVSI